MKTVLFGLGLALAVLAITFFVNAKSRAAAQETGTPAQKAATPEQRVKAFIADFHRTHAKHPMKSTSFDAWEAAIRVLDGVHFTNGAGMALAGSMSDRSDHDPANEKITTTTVRDDATFVETEVSDRSRTSWNEYELRQIEGDWRIARIRNYLTPEGKPLVDEKDRVRLTTPKLIPLRAIPEVEAFDGNSLMNANRKVRFKDEDKQSELQVREVGKLNVRTGTLVVSDFGYGAYLFIPLSIHVPAGHYKVHVATAFGRNAALQITFSEAAVRQWHPADVTTGGHVVGVDAGNMAVFDTAAVLTISDRNHKRVFDRYAKLATRPGAEMLTATDKDDVVIADSGFGDGTYPVYWGMDAQEKPAVLLVDFFLSELVEIR